MVAGATEGPLMNSEGSILLVEDDPDDRELIRLAFERAAIPCRLIVLTDGEKALEYFRGSGLYAQQEELRLPRLVLLDLAMPRVSGFEVLEWVRSQPTLRQLPIVVLSGSTFSADVRRAYLLGANSFFTKPVDFSELALCLKKMAAFWLHSGEEKMVA